jgi:hypothetical protein
LLADVLGSGLATTLIGAFLASPLVTALYNQASSFRDAYWRKIAASLDGAIPESSPKRVILNLEKSTLESGRTEARRNALRKILDGTTTIVHTNRIEPGHA